MVRHPGHFRYARWVDSIGFCHRTTCDWTDLGQFEYLYASYTDQRTVSTPNVLQIVFPAGLGGSFNIHVVRNGLDLNRFQTQPIPADRVSLLAVGRLYPGKRWDKLLRCISTLASRGLRFTVNLAGDGPLRAELEAEAKPLVMRGLLKFLGFRQDIPELLARSTFLVHTADAEGCPNVIMEAMATGRAVVATDSGDVPYLVEHGKTGLVVSRRDDSALVEAVERLIVDPVLCEKMGKAGRARSEQEFGLDRLVSETLNAYCVAGWRGPLST